jgi:hypothetical protein
MVFLEQFHVMDNQVIGSMQGCQAFLQTSMKDWSGVT